MATEQIDRLKTIKVENNLTTTALSLFYFSACVEYLPSFFLLVFETSIFYDIHMYITNIKIC